MICPHLPSSRLAPCTTPCPTVLPLLALCGLSFRHIMGFLIIFFLVTVSIGSAAFLVAPLFF